MLSEARHSISMNPLPVLACQFFIINYLHSSKGILFQHTVDLILIVKLDIIVIVMNTNRNKCFYLKGVLSSVPTHGFSSNFAY